MMFFDELHKQGEEMPHLKHFEKDGIEIKRGFTFDAGKVMNRLWNEGFSTWYCSAHYYWAMINKEKKQIVFNTEGDIDTVKCKDYVALSKEVKRTLDFLKGYDKSLFEEALNYIEDTILLVEYRENA